MSKQLSKFLVLAAALALTVPMVAQAKPSGDPPYGKAKGHGPVYAPGEPGNGDATPGPKAGMPEKARAYGRYCSGESRKRVAGEKGTPFSRCVTAMARAAQQERITAKRACRGLSKKHVKGEKGTEFSRCVKAAAKLRAASRRDQS